MTDQRSTPDRPPAGASAHDDADLTVTRTGTRTARATNSRGASVLVGGEGAPEAFTPGELLQIALAACEALSADHRIAHGLGADAEVVTRVTREKDEADNRYTDLHVEMSLDLSALAPDAEERLRERIDAAVERHCTVGRTLRAGAATTLTVSSRDAGTTS
ncbi:MAG: OsmC family protein [Actinomycetaceae bacterium]